MTTFIQSNWAQTKFPRLLEASQVRDLKHLPLALTKTFAIARVPSKEEGARAQGCI